MWQKFKTAVSQFIQGYQTQFFPEKTLTIDRKTWLRGQGLSASFLLCPTSGKRCCLGFYYSFLGLSDQEISGHKNPNSFSIKLRQKLDGIDAWLFDIETSGCETSLPSKDMDHLLRYNDYRVGTYLSHDKNLVTEKYREQKIKEIFACHGIKVRFIN